MAREVWFAKVSSSASVPVTKREYRPSKSGGIPLFFIQVVYLLSSPSAIFRVSTLLIRDTFSAIASRGRGMVALFKALKNSSRTMFIFPAIKSLKNSALITFFSVIGKVNGVPQYSIPEG